MKLSGVFPVLCTPFGDDGAVAPDQFDRVIDFVLRAGAEGCVFPGVASEVDTLSADERGLLVARLGARLKGRIPFIVGASDPDPEAVLTHIESGAQAGAAVAMVIAQGAIGQDIDAQLAYFKRVGADSPLPLMLQNQPVPIGAGLKADDMATLARAVPAIRYVKEETLPCGQNLTLIREACGDTIEGVFGGAGGRYVIDELARGGLGTMPASEFADLHVRMVGAWQRGYRDEARRLYEVSLPALTFQAVFRMHMTKETLRRRGVLETTHVRGKGPKMDAGDRAELAALLHRLSPEFQTDPLAEATREEQETII